MKSNHQKNDQYPQSILIYANYGVYTDPKTGEHYLPSIQHRYLEALRGVGFENITLLSKVSDAPQLQFDKKSAIPDLKVQALPWFDNYLDGTRHFLSFLKAFRELSLQQFDRVFIRVFEPFTWLLVIFFALRDREFTQNNLIMHFIAHPKSAIFGNRGHSWLKKISRYCAFLPEYLMTIMATLLCRPTANGPVPILDLPRWLSSRFTEVLESALLESDVANVFSKRSVSGQRTAPFQVMFAGFLRNSKGIDTLLEAVRILQERGDDRYRFHIVGEGEMRPVIEQFILNHGLDNRFVLHGYIPFSGALFDCYVNADIFVNPSVSETGPRVLLEARLFGTYLVSTDVGYARRIIEDERSGVFFPIGDAERLAEAISDAGSLLESGTWDPPRDLADFSHNLTAEGFFREALALESIPR